MGAGATKRKDTAKAIAESSPAPPAPAQAAASSRQPAEAPASPVSPASQGAAAQQEDGGPVHFAPNVAVQGFFRAASHASSASVGDSSRDGDSECGSRSHSHSRAQPRRKKTFNRLGAMSSENLAEPEDGEAKKDESKVSVSLEDGNKDEDDDEGEAFGRKRSIRASKIVQDKLDPELYAFLRSAFEKHFLLKSVPETEYKKLIFSMKVKYAEPGEVIVSEGAHSESVYFIRKGIFSAMQNGEEMVHNLGAGDSFGELALMYGSPIENTIAARENGELWKMERSEFMECKESMGSSQREQAVEFFQSCLDFRGLKQEDQEALADVSSVVKFADGAIMLREKEMAEYMYVVMKGKVSTSEDTFEMSDRGIYGKFGSIIGGVGILYDNRQVLGAYANGNVECLALSKAALSNFSSAVMDVLRRSAFKAMLHNLPRTPGDPEPWRILSQEQQHLLISRAEDGVFEPEEIIFAPGDDAQLVIVVSGQMAIMKQIAGAREVDQYVFVEGGNIVEDAEKVLADGSAYGKQPELLEGIPMSRFGVAVGKVRLHRITHTSVMDALGESLMEVMRHAEIKRVLSDIFLFKNLQEEQIDCTVRELEQRVYAAGEVIVKEGDDARHFFLIQRGNVIVRKGDQVLRTLGRWDYFGERGLLLQEKRSATCQALDECICLVLDAEEFFGIVGHFRSELERRMHLQDLNLSVNDLKCKAVVGRGTFGIVRLVHPKNKDKPEYALKCVKKLQVVRGRQEKAIAMEREVNAQCYHPCIVQFIKTFQDKHNVYFLTEFLGGGDLFYAIRAIGALTKLQSQFFSGSICLGIEYLHGRGIMYRDLKPENVLLDFSGKAKLVDFGCCKKEMRTKTLIGTPEYLAPEVIKGKGYTCCVDWWSLGVMLYEFVVGPIPFGAGEEDQVKLFQAITEAELTFPDYVQEDAVVVLRGLLERRPDRRLGASSMGAKEIKEQSYFKGFDWDALAGGFFPPPYSPDIQEQMRTWEEPDGDLQEHFSKESFTFTKGMEWAKIF